jgi:arabinan endo-1,5-alpha-L-arabinosidase
MQRPSTLPWLFCIIGLLGISAASAQQVEVHDPVMIRDADTYYVFSTGPGITIYQSTDLARWHWVGRVFEQAPAWTTSVAPEFTGHMWAPDIFEQNGRFYLYYSVSAFGKNTSGIGVAVNETLDPSSPDYRWVDRGPVLQSVPNRDDWNAIDPAIIKDADGTPWMSYGSFWSGIKLVKLDPGLDRIAEPQEWYSLARRPRQQKVADDNAGDGAIEAPYILEKDGWYYLFVSFDKCCRGMDSTYKIMVGRAKSVTGPYADRDGTPMLDGGGTLVLEGTDDWVALGHNAAYRFDDRDWLVFHAYETADQGKQKLKVLPLHWDDSWPVADPADLNRRTTELIGPAPPENHPDDD